MWVFIILLWWLFYELPFLLWLSYIIFFEWDCDPSCNRYSTSLSSWMIVLTQSKSNFFRVSLEAQIFLKPPFMPHTTSYNYNFFRVFIKKVVRIVFKKWEDSPPIFGAVCDLLVPAQVSTDAPALAQVIFWLPALAQVNIDLPAPAQVNIDLSVPAQVSIDLLPCPLPGGSASPSSQCTK
jgi:hypothetical protein